MLLVFVRVVLYYLLSVVLYLISFFFFFFQAEDGIRDLYVTGVQTCALPIYTGDVPVNDYLKHLSIQLVVNNFLNKKPNFAYYRSEERRVGKECRSRWSSEH